jgi:hypothetical protein
MAVIIAAILGVVYFFYLVLYPFKTVDLKEPIQVLNANKEVARGGDLILEIEYVKYDSFPVTSNKNIICEDGNLVTMASNSTNLPKGEQKFVVTFTVPQKTSIGNCYLQYVNVYEVNPIRNITKVWTTETFKVVNEVTE